MRFLLFYISSLIVVSFGQPYLISWLCPLSASMGYGICLYALSLLKKGKKRFFLGVIWFFFVQMVHLSWMISLKYQGWYIVLVAILLSLLFSLQLNVFVFYVLSKGRLRIWHVSVGACLATIVEWTRLFILSGFGLSFAGLTLAVYPISMQFASVFGILGLSFLVWIANGFFFILLKEGKKWPNCTLFLATALFPYFFGLVSIAQAKNKPQGKQVSTLFIQTALSPSQKVFMKKYPEEFISLYEQWKEIMSYCLSHEGQKIDLIIMPENVVPYGFRLCIYKLDDIERLLKQYIPHPNQFYPPLSSPYATKSEAGWLVSNGFILQTISSFLHAEIVAGLDDFDPLSFEHYNAAVCFTPGAFEVERYEKQVLLPLAESLPFDFLKKFTKLYGISDFFTPGAICRVLSDKYRMGVNICIEETIPEIVRGFKKNGAKILVNLTNDAWYPNTELPLAHFSYARLRAVENGLTVLRACNTGVTAIIDSYGLAEKLLEPETRGTLAQRGCALKKVVFCESFTLYSFWGDSAIIVLSLFVLLYDFIFISRFNVFSD